jgi:hypothetical protein
MSMDKAAMEMSDTIATATSAMVNPHSLERGFASLCERRISGVSIGTP